LEDYKKCEFIDLRNQADQLVYQTEKTLKEHGDKIPESERKAIEEAVKKLNSVKSTDNADEIKTAMETLNQASHKLAEAMYKEAQSKQQTQAGPEQHEAEGGGKEAEAGANEDDVVDADFEEVKD